MCATSLESLVVLKEQAWLCGASRAVEELDPRNVYQTDRFFGVISNKSCWKTEMNFCVTNTAIAPFRENGK